MDTIYYIIGGLIVIGSPVFFGALRMFDQRKIESRICTDREAAEAARFVTIEHDVKQLKTDVTHAHDKIRDLDARQTATNDTLISIQSDLRHITVAVDKISAWIEGQR